jgi:hypothetical protein
VEALRKAVAGLFTHRVIRSNRFQSVDIYLEFAEGGLGRGNNRM